MYVIYHSKLFPLIFTFKVLCEDQRKKVQNHDNDFKDKHEKMIQHTMYI